MASVKLNPILDNVHGHVGDLIFRRYQGRTVMSGRPEQVNQPNSPAQLGAREKFHLASLYGRAVLADPQTKALYTDKSRQKGIPAFALMVADFMNLPVVNEVDLSGYAGNTGDKIIIRASDDFEVKGVSVQMKEPDTGEEMDGGEAVRGNDGVWTFTAQSNIPKNHPFVIDVTATDRPGHKGTKTQTHTVT